MKKLLIIAAIVLSACTKQDEYQNVKFNYKIVEENSMTKTINHETVQSMIKGAMPTNISPKLYLNKDETSQAIEITMGSSMTMKVATYLAKWKNSPSKIENVMIDKVYWSKTPLMDIYADIDIVAGVSEYSIPVTFKSFAIVADTTEVKQVEFLTLGKSWSKINSWITSGNHLILFVNGDLVDDTVLGLQLIPKDVSRKKTFIYFSSNLTTYDNTSVIKPSYGKYYTIHPDAVTEWGSIFDLDIPDWSCGD